MFIYDVIAFIFIGISHILFYLKLIRYNKMSTLMIFTISVIFTIFLSTVVTMTGYPEFNTIMLLIFLLCLGLMKDKLPLMHNLYFALVSIVMITYCKIILLEVGFMLLIWSPFHLYIWTQSLIHLVVSAFLLLSILLLSKPIDRFAKFIVTSPLYYVTYFLLWIGLFIALILTYPQTNLLSDMFNEYGQVSYKLAIILFFILLLIVIISIHLMKVKIEEEQEKKLDETLLDYVRKLEHMYDDLASFRHDYLNILLSLSEGIRTENMEEIKRVYENVIAPTVKIMNHHELEIVKLSNIAIPEVKGLLSSKLISAQQQNINVMMDIPEKIKGVPIHIVTFIRAISIILDNAIEEAVKSKEKQLQIAFFEMDNGQYFIVRNSYQNDTVDLQKIYEKHYSSKGEKRGIGLYSLKRLLEKMDNVTLETSVEHPFFTQVLILKH